LIVAAGPRRAAICGERHAIDPGHVAEESQQLLTRADVPQTRRQVTPAGQAGMQWLRPVRIAGAKEEM